VPRPIQTLIHRALVGLEPSGGYVIKEKFFEEWIRRRVVRGEL